MNRWIPLLLLAVLPAAFAKLPPLSPEAKAKADEAAARAAWNNKVAVFKLCESQDAVAARFFASAQAAGRDVHPPVPTPPCEDPGPFSYTPPDQKPLESAGAHSPAGTAATPHNTDDPESETTPPQNAPEAGEPKAGASAPAKPEEAKPDAVKP